MLSGRSVAFSAAHLHLRDQEANKNNETRMHSCKHNCNMKSCEHLLRVYHGHGGRIGVWSILFERSWLPSGKFWSRPSDQRAHFLQVDPSRPSSAPLPQGEDCVLIILMLLVLVQDVRQHATLITIGLLSCGDFLQRATRRADTPPSSPVGVTGISQTLAKIRRLCTKTNINFQPLIMLSLSYIATIKFNCSNCKAEVFCAFLKNFNAGLSSVKFVSCWLLMSFSRPGTSFSCVIISANQFPHLLIVTV